MKKALSFVLGCLLILTVVLPIATAAHAAGNVLFTVVVNSSESEINFRSGNSTSSGVITMIPNGTTLDIYDMVWRIRNI